jgi:hypothetical protein
MVAATIEHLAFGILSWRESHEVDRRGCLSTGGIANRGTRLLENLSECLEQACAVPQAPRRGDGEWR